MANKQNLHNSLNETGSVILPSPGRPLLYLVTALILGILGLYLLLPDENMRNSRLIAAPEAKVTTPAEAESETAVNQDQKVPQEQVSPAASTPQASPTQAEAGAASAPSGEEHNGGDSPKNQQM